MAENKAPTPVILTASGLTATVGARILIDNQELIIREGEHVGLVGRNGSGKSTLMKILAGTEHFYAGRIDMRPGLRCVFMPQEIALDDGATIRENILSGAADTLQLIHQYENHLGNIAPEELERQITARDGWNLESRMLAMATAMEVPDLERRAGELSGGEKRRVAICRALVDLPELLMLDEPTNHLDTPTVEWLEQYIARLKTACLYVTHDRFFLDRTCTRIVELDHGKLYSIPGNYGDFLRKKAERAENERLTEERRLSFIRREIDWIRRGPKARGTKSWARIQRFNDAVNAGPPPPDRDVELMLPEPPPFGNIIAKVNDVTLQRGEKTVLKNFTLEFQPGMRLGILGRNGAGKSSLLKLLNGELQPTLGSIRIGERTQINYADQHRVCLNDHLTVAEDIGEGNEYVMVGNRKVAIWTYLRRFLFQDEEITSKVGELSGGERNRLVLAKLLKLGGNFLMMDEPTNDLDLNTLRVLEESLIQFDGCVAVVSHDRYFLNRVCTHILAFQDDGSVIFQPGDYDYYLEKRNQRQQEEQAQAQAQAAAAQSKAQAASAVNAPQGNKKRSGLSWKEERELEGMEEQIAVAEDAVAQLEALFAAPDFHTKYALKTKELTAQLDAARAETERLYARWAELEEKKQ